MEIDKSSVYEEYQYLNIVKDIIDNGEITNDRTGVGTKRVIGRLTRWNLENNIIPVLTTKKVLFRSVVEELLWFLSGSTDGEKLNNKGVKIWNANGKKEILDKLGFTNRREGDLGPIYSHQWRHSGAKYIDCDTNYTGKGIDQIKNLIYDMKKNPQSRRLIINSWNPSDIQEMALPPCHISSQFIISSSGEVSCFMNQRSADMGLGVPFNIVSYSLLNYIISKICGYKPKEFIHFTMDTHVYLNHIDGLNQQLTRKPFDFPKLFIHPDLKSLDDFTNLFEQTKTSEDLEKFIKLDNYQSHPYIKLEMAV
jgi:thymidylate synthase